MTDLEREWSVTATDLGGWANRAMQQLQRAEKAEAELAAGRVHSPYPEMCDACSSFFGTSRTCEQPVEERLLELAGLREAVKEALYDYVRDGDGLLGSDVFDRLRQLIEEKP